VQLDTGSRQRRLDARPGIDRCACFHVLLREVHAHNRRNLVVANDGTRSAADPAPHVKYTVCILEIHLSQEVRSGRRAAHMKLVTCLQIGGRDRLRALAHPLQGLQHIFQNAWGGIVRCHGRYCHRCCLCTDPQPRPVAVGGASVPPTRPVYEPLRLAGSARQANACRQQGGSAQWRFRMSGGEADCGVA